MMLTQIGQTDLQKSTVGVKVAPDIDILDIAQTDSGDYFVLCFNPHNPVHKFVTWGIDPQNLSHRWSGHYAFTIEEALEDFNLRVGRVKSNVET